MSPAEMDKHLQSLLDEQFRLRTQRATGQLTQTARLKSLRREVARLKTLQAEQAK